MILYFINLKCFINYFILQKYKYLFLKSNFFKILITLIKFLEDYIKK